MLVRNIKNAAVYASRIQGVIGNGIGKLGQRKTVKSRYDTSHGGATLVEAIGAWRQE